MPFDLEKICEDYKADEDPNGAIGHYLANALFEKREIEKMAKDVELSMQYDFLEEAKKYRPRDISYYNKGKANLLKKYFNLDKIKVGNDKKTGKDLYYTMDNCLYLNPKKIGKVFEIKYKSIEKKLKKFEK